jgi:hypothetical protein
VSRVLGFAGALVLSAVVWVGVARAAAPTNCGSNNGFSGASVTQSANTTQSASVALGFNTEDYDTDSYHDNTTANTRLVAPVTGYYALSGEMGTSSGAVSSWADWFGINGGTRRFGYQWSTGGANAINATQVVHLSVGDYVELFVYSSGSSWTTDHANTTATITWLGQCSTAAGGSTTLHALTDVNDAGKTAGSVLKYDTATSKWIVGTDSEGAGGTYDGPTTDDFTTAANNVHGDLWFAIGILAFVPLGYGMWRVLLV